jgi:hypothetical protein
MQLFRKLFKTIFAKKVMQVFKKIGLVFFLVFILSCKKDDVKTNPVPSNPCEGIECLNGGNCVNGQCKCPDNYTGPDCSQQKTPIRIRISAISVTKFPPTKTNGASWDLTSGPDIYVLLKSNNKELFNSGYIQNADPNKSHMFTPNNTIDVTDIYNECSLELYDDDDFGSDELMGGYKFFLYDSKNGFPATINLKNPSGSVHFEVFISYIF